MTEGAALAEGIITDGGVFSGISSPATGARTLLPNPSIAAHGLLLHFALFGDVEPEVNDTLSDKRRT